MMTEPPTVPPRRGRNARDIQGLINAAVWVVYLDPAAPPKPRTMTDVAECLLASKVPAVRALVGNAHCKRLCNLLAAHRHEILLPAFEALINASQWAEDGELAARPLETATATSYVTFAPTGSRLQYERDAVMLARAVGDRADTLPPEAQRALRRILQQQANYEANMGVLRGRPNLPG
jgi:hypothetical protein